MASTNVIDVYYHSLSSNETTYLSDASSNLICNFYVNYQNLTWTTNGPTPTSFQSVLFYQNGPSSLVASSSIAAPSGFTGYSVSVNSSLPTISFQTGNLAVNPNDPSNTSGATISNITVPYTTTTSTTSNVTTVYQGQNGTFCLPLVPIPFSILTSYPTVYVGYAITYSSTTVVYYGSVGVSTSASSNSFKAHVFDTTASGYSLPKVTLSNITPNQNYISSTSFTGAVGPSISTSTMRTYITNELNAYGSNLNWMSMNATWSTSTASVTGYIFTNMTAVKTSPPSSTNYYGNYLIITTVNSGTLVPGMGYLQPGMGGNYVFIVDIFPLMGTYTFMMMGGMTSSLVNPIVCTLTSNGGITTATSPATNSWSCSLITSPTILSGHITPGTIVKSGMTGTTVSGTTWPPMIFPVSYSVTSSGGSSQRPITSYGVFWNTTAATMTPTLLKAYSSVTTASWYTFNNYWEGATGALGVATGNTRMVYTNTAPVDTTEINYTQYSYGTGPNGLASFYTAMTNPPAGTASTPYLYLGMKYNNMTWAGWTGPIDTTVPTIVGGSTSAGSPTGSISIVSTSVPTHPTACFLYQTGSPDFSSSSGFDSSSPNRLQNFLSSPFLASAYTSFSTLAEFIGAAPCLCRGMKLFTPQGPVPVEDLRAGDLVYAPPDNRSVPIVSIHGSKHKGDPKNLPYRIPKDFLAPGVPDEDIVLSPHHMYFYDGSWRLPKFTGKLKKETELLGEEFEYYHVQLPNYYTDKLWCHNVPVDSWEKKKDEPPLI